MKSNSEIPIHIQRRATEIYFAKHCSWEEAYEKAFLEDKMAKEGFPQDIGEFFGGIFRRRK